MGPILFVLFVNDLPSSRAATVQLFADDTTLYRQMLSRTDCQLLQDDSNTLSGWSKLWLLNFNASKCVVLKMRADLEFIYTRTGIDLKTVSKQKDLDVLISLMIRYHGSTY